MTLGRSLDDVRENGFERGSLGGISTPKCASGLITCHLTDRYIDGLYVEHYPEYLTVGWTADDLRVLSIAAQALVVAAPKSAVKRVLDRNDDLVNSFVQNALAGSEDTDDLDVFVVRVNDAGIADVAEMRQWFSDALDHLAEQLPIPAGPLFVRRELTAV